jgi:hypothetical protein
MNNYIRGMMLAFCLALLVGCALGASYYERNSANVLYRGEVVFYSEEEYIGFKKFMLSDDIEIGEIDVMASDPPIWVRYDNIETPRSLEFPYPVEYMHVANNYKVQVPLVFGMVAGLMGIVGIIGLWPCKRHE